MVDLKDWKVQLDLFFKDKSNQELLDNNQFKELFIKAIEEGIPFDALSQLLDKANVQVNTQQIKDELYLLAIKILKN